MSATSERKIDDTTLEMHNSGLTCMTDREQGHRGQNNRGRNDDGS